jgi:FSR family fosmidomycin resistance protein-like MFS transporter
MYVPRSRLFWAVSLGHMTNDTFISMGPVVLAFISVNLLPLSTVEIGVILGITALLGAVSQPLFGFLADRGGGRWLGAGGVAITVGVMLLALLAAEARNYPLMVLAFILPAVGSGAFHPVGTMHAADSDRRYAASNLAYFFLLGQLGLAAGPALAGLLLNNAGTYNHVFTAALGPALSGSLMERGTVLPIFALTALAVPGVLLMAWSIPNRAAHRTTRSVESETPAPARAAIPLLAFIILISMVTLRSLAQPGSVNFIPILFQSKGWSPAEYGFITSSFWLASGLAGVFFGGLADRFDRRWVIAISLILSAPAFFLLPAANGVLAFALAIAAGGLSGGSHSIIVVFAQGLLPRSKGFASGMILGLIFGTGAVGNFLIGWLSDTVGLETAFQLVAGAIVVASVLALALPGSQPRHARPAPAAQPGEALVQDVQA